MDSLRLRFKRASNSLSLNDWIRSVRDGFIRAEELDCTDLTSNELDESVFLTAEDNVIYQLIAETEKT